MATAVSATAVSATAVRATAMPARLVPGLDASVRPDDGAERQHSQRQRPHLVVRQRASTLAASGALLDV
jgi:hypothetical protein